MGKTVQRKLWLQLVSEAVPQCCSIERQEGIYSGTDDTLFPFPRQCFSCSATILCRRKYLQQIAYEALKPQVGDTESISYITTFILRPCRGCGYQPVK